ncbi:MAG: YdhR family protein [Promethearchaeota archaeon]|jgi:hypothetical protein
MEILVFLFRSGLSMEELMKVSKTRGERFKKVKGLIQKYYVSDKESNRIGGVYLFDSKKNLKAFRNSELSKTTPEAYQFLDEPYVKILDVLRPLKEQEELLVTAE